MKYLVRKRLLAIAMGVVSLSFSFGNSPARATLLSAEISATIPDDLYAELAYIFSQFDEPPSAEVLQYVKFLNLHIIRIDDPEFCERNACLGFVILECKSAICPYASAPIGNFAISDAGYDRKVGLGAQFEIAIHHEAYEVGEGPQATFAIGDGFVAARYVRIKSQR